MTIRKLELLQAEADEADDSYFRLLVNGNSIKYITIKTGIYSVEDMCFGPSLVTLLPAFPPGNWNDGLVSKNPDDGKPYFARTGFTQFPSVQNTWHGRFIDYMDLEIGRKVRTGIYDVTSLRPASASGTGSDPSAGFLFDKPVVAKFARFHWEVGYMETETTAYEWIAEHDIAPKFLGHLTEHGRVIGFLMERITNARHAGVQDLDACKKVLSRLHALGVRHGDTNRFNFLIRNGKATLIDFDTARKCNDPEELQREMEGLKERFEDMSGRGGGGLL